MAFVTQNGIPTLIYVTNSGQVHKIVFTGSSAAPSDLVSLTPARLADTRTGASTVDGLFAGGGPQPGGSTLALTVTGRGGVAVDAAAVSLNVTATNSAGAGFVTVFPCGATQPTASNLNYTAGSIVPNAVISKVGAGGKVCLFVNVATDLVVDVGGYFPQLTRLVSTNPARVLDTRVGFTTFDGLQQGGGLRGAGSVTEVQIAGRLGIPSNAAAVVLNVTVTEPSAAGYVTVYPCGANPPLASNVNVVQGSTVAVMVVAKIGADGKVCIFTQSPAQLVADVDGYLPASTTYTPLLPGAPAGNAPWLDDGRRPSDGSRHPTARHGHDAAGHRPRRSCSRCEDRVVERDSDESRRRRIRDGLSLRHHPARIESQLRRRPDRCKCNDREARSRRRGLSVQLRGD